MADHAAHTRDVARDVSGVELDYSVESLALVDDILGGFHDDGVNLDAVAETASGFGAYVGEVIVRNAGGAWSVLPPDHPMGGAWPMVTLPNGNIVNPVAKAFKRVSNGEVDHIPYFYQVLVADPSR
jgi:Family of unknown function (DUF6278)